MLIILIVIPSFIVLTQAVIIVPAGNRGVVLTWGQVTGILSEGLHFITPISKKVVLMDVTIQKVEAFESTASSDLQEVTTSIAVNYRLNAGYVDEIYRDMRKEYEQRVIVPNIEESIKATTALFRAEELITKRSEVKLRFDEILSERLDQFHIEVLSVSITDFQFSQEFMDAVEAKVTAEQRALEAKNKLEQIKYEAQQKVIQAEAEANATILRATAQAEANTLISQSLTSLYLQYMTLEKWDGVLPQYFGGEAIPFLQIPTNSTTP